MGVSFKKRKEIWKIKLSDEIDQIIFDMKQDLIDCRCSIDCIMKRLFNFCEQKKEFESIDIFQSLKKKEEIFMQSPLNDGLLLLEGYKQKNEIDNLEIIENNNCSTLKLNDRTIIDGFRCVLIDFSLGYFDYKKQCFCYDNKTFSLDNFGYPFYEENIYFADLKTLSFIKCNRDDLLTNK